MRTFACFVIVSFAGCASPVEKPLQTEQTPALSPAISVIDLRANQWKKTSVFQNSQGVTQYLGDDKFPQDLPIYIANRIALTLSATEANKVVLKTADVHLSIPGAKIDGVQTSTLIAMNAALTLPMFNLLSNFERNKTAAAVFCVNVDGLDYFGSDARLFRFGPEGELKDSISAAIKMLERNIATKTRSDNIACEPGWEGGQPRAQ